MMRLLTLGLVVAACQRGDSLPPVQAGGPPPSSGAPGASSDPIRQDYATLLGHCEERREQLQEELNDARRRDRNLSVAAAAVYVAGELADSANDSDVHTGMGGQPECPTDRNPERPGPCPQPVPSVTAGQGGPTTSDTEAIRAEALSTIAAINRSIDESDAFLFSHPTVGRWQDEERAQWEELQSELALHCRSEASEP